MTAGWTAADIAKSLGVDRGSDGNFLVPCPVPSHGKGRGDRNPSCSIRDGDHGNLVMHCFAGCDHRDVRRAAAERGWGVRSNHHANGARKQKVQPAADTSGSISSLCHRGWRATAYPYEDENGATVFENVRLELFDNHGHRVEKTFRYRRHDGDGNVVENLDGIAPLPYRLQDILADTGAVIWVVEGEKDADALAAIGRTATSVSKWTEEIIEHFRGRDVVVVPDNDDAGAKRAAKANAALLPVVKSLRIAHPPVLDPSRAVGWDMADFLEMGGNIADVPAVLVVPAQNDGPIWWNQIGIRPSAGYLVKGILHPGDFACIFGESYTGKSHLALDLALSVASGATWQGHRVSQSSVLYLALEGWRGFEHRVAVRRQEFAAHVPLALWMTSLDFTDGTKTQDLIEIVKRLADVAPKVGLIVIDTLARALGGNDENTSQGMGVIISASARIQRETGACALWVHHVGKDANRGPRGHSSLLAALDTGIKVTREEGGFSRARVEKQKDGEGGQAWDFRILPVPLGYDQDGDMITAGVPEFIDVASHSPGRKRPTGQADAALKILRTLIRDTGNAKHGVVGIPDGQMTVDEASWRQECMRLKLGNGEIESEQKAFKRASASLANEGHVTQMHGQVWPTSTQAQAGQTRTNNGHVRDVYRTDTDTPLRGVSDVRDGDVMIDGYVGDDGHS